MVPMKSEVCLNWSLFRFMSDGWMSDYYFLWWWG